MLFSSPIFFAFFAVYFLLHIFIPLRYRTLLIIVGSTVFYASWRLEYVVLPYLLMAVAFFGTAWMVQAESQSSRRSRLIFTIVLLFAPLFFFKYTDFIFRDVLGPLLGNSKNILGWPLPLGISFVTFTMTAYVVDIYHRAFTQRSSFKTVLAYVLFFPHLIAGPILRPHELIPQLERPRPAFQIHARAAILIFTIGLVKKLIFADQIAAIVDAVYSGGSHDAAQSLLAIYGFSVQIYCDFSGYTDMAIGVAMLIGVRLPNNFMRPYAATSLIEFWRRWHITLSHWLRDYLYIPLGGNRGGLWSLVRNIMITMVLGGLWHGANWTFVIWGALHGAGLSFIHAIRRISGGLRAVRMSKLIGLVLTFNFVTLAWVFFRAPNFRTAGNMLAAPFVQPWPGFSQFFSHNFFYVGLILLFFCLHPFDDHRRFRAMARYARLEIFWPFVVLLWVLAISLSQMSSAKFIYFDF